MCKKLLLIVSFLVFQSSIAQYGGSSSNNNLYDYETVNYQPQFPGGFKEFIKFIGKNYVTPETDGLSGIVKIDFVIEADGIVSSIKVISDIGEGTGAEAVRVLSKCPNWSPGEQDGKKVRVVYHNFPITIRN